MTHTRDSILRPPQAPFHIQEDDLLLYVSGQLPADRISIVDLHVVSCVACAAKLEEAVAFVTRAARNRPSVAVTHAEHRSEHRVPTDQTAFLQVLQPLSLNRVIVVIRNTSRNGLGLSVPMRLDAGSLVQLRIENMVVLGEVRYCVQNGTVFDAGICVEDIHYAPARR